MTSPIHIDLTTALSLIPDDVTASNARSGCRYTAPCVVGSMMTPDERENLRLADYDFVSIGILIQNGNVTTPLGQKRDLAELQAAYDSMDTAGLRRLIAQLKEKYL